jgi:diaminopimelate epimerase
MAAYYDARGNTYFVASPEEIRGFADLPRTAAEAASTRERWARRAIERICGRLSAPEGIEAGGAKRYRSDGLLVGPFPDGDAFALLIVNTDGTLAERSGNGLTIFSQCLVDGERAKRSHAFFLRVYDLEKIEATWTCSQFVNVGNPHCVTFLKNPDLLPTMEQLGSRNWVPGLSAIANSTASNGLRGAGRPCRNGINLQWACVTGPDSIDARVFERGEGPTLSSGSSATAVACAARKLGLIDAKTVNVRMPGGLAPVRFDERNGSLERVMLFGEARQANPPV